MKAPNRMGHRVIALATAVSMLATYQPAWAQDSNAGRSSSSSSTGSGGRSSTSSSNNSSSNSNSSNNSSSSSSSGSSIFGKKDSNRNKNNNSNKGGNRNQPQSATGLNRQTGKQQQRTIKGQATQKKGGGQAKSTPVEFKMKANPNVNILEIEGLSGAVPSLNIQADEGSTFPVRVSFRNARASRFQSVDISLKYEPSVLRPEIIDDLALRPKLEGDPKFTVDTRRGVIHWSARFAEPQESSSLEFFRLTFRGVSAASYTPLTFLNTDTDRTAILNADGTNILQLKDEEGEAVASERAGLLDAGVAVVPGPKTRATLRDQEGTLAAIAMVNQISDGTAKGGMTVALKARNSAVKVGEDVLVDISYNNPTRAEIDTVKLLIRFDPSVLQVVDDDEGNWIAKGLNIHDGPYHDDLPFDFHRKNVAYNARGEIMYENGFRSRVRIPTSGVIATIRFRAVAEAPSTPVVFDLDDQSSHPATSMSFLGFNLIGTPGKRAVSVADAVVTVRR